MTLQLDCEHGLIDVFRGVLREAKQQGRLYACEIVGEHELYKDAPADTIAFQVLGGIVQGEAPDAHTVDEQASVWLAAIPDAEYGRLPNGTDVLSRFGGPGRSACQPSRTGGQGWGAEQPWATPSRTT